jgi:TonB family protein
MHRLGASAANLEHLTISELKKLMADIEHRVSRIDPQADTAAAGGGSPITDVGARKSEAALFEGVARPSESGAPGDISRGLRGAILPFESGGRSAPARSKFDEAAFLERHPYMKPNWRNATADEAAASLVSAAAVSAAAVSAAAPSAPAAPVPVAAVASPEAVPGTAGSAPVAPPVLEKSGTVAPARAVVAPDASFATPPAAQVAALLPTAIIHPGPFSQPAPFNAPPWIDADGPRIRFRISLRGFALMAVLFTVVGGSAGYYIYHSLHVKTIDDFPDLKQTVSSNGGRGSAVAGDAGSDAEVILSSSDDPLMGMNSPAGERDAASSVRSKPKAKIQAVLPPVAVWPRVNQAVSGEAGGWTPSAGALAVTKHAAGGGTVAASHRTVEGEGPLHVPSTVMMGYAVSVPKPVYPAGILKGITGTVVVEVAISREGTVTGAWAVSGPDELRPAAVQAVQGWRFRPYQVDGDPAEVTTTLGFFFNGR